MIRRRSLRWTNQYLHLSRNKLVFPSSWSLDKSMHSTASKMTKRKASPASTPSKRVKISHEQYPNEQYPDWPAPRTQIETAREFITETVQGQHRTLIVPDKDADGLSSGKIIYHTLTALGLPKGLISVHLLSKATSLFHDDEKAKMENFGATRVIVLDQGSRGGRELVDPKCGEVKTLLLDHHQSEEFPDHSIYVTACDSPPISTTSLLTYLICQPLHLSVKEECDWVAVLGVIGDLGTSEVKWGQGPWPAHLADAEKRFTKKAISDAVSMMNAPRRTAEYNVDAAWRAVLEAQNPKEISSVKELIVAREKVNREVERCTHTAPIFSKDGRVALFRISSAYQVHPVIATRWAGHLKSKKLQLIMVANPGYNPSGMHTHFSCRISAPLRKLPESERPNLLEILKEYAAKIDDPGFMERSEGNFAKGHKEATGGQVLTDDFELFTQAMEIGVKPDLDPNATPKKSKLKAIDPSQTNRLTSYFQTKPSPAKKEEEG